MISLTVWPDAVASASSAKGAVWAGTARLSRVTTIQVVIRGRRARQPIVLNIIEIMVMATWPCSGHTDQWYARLPVLIGILDQVTDQR